MVLPMTDVILPSLLAFNNPMENNVSYFVSGLTMIAELDPLLDYRSGGWRKEDGKDGVCQRMGKATD
jgi:hypothetical protein